MTALYRVIKLGTGGRNAFARSDAELGRRFEETCVCALHGNL